MPEQIVKINFDHHPRTFKALNNGNYEFLSLKETTINVQKSVLDKALEEQKVNEYFNYVECPCCGRLIPEGLTVVYRDNGGCVGKQIVCVDCTGLNNEAFWALKCAQPDVKYQAVVALLNDDPKTDELLGI